MSILVLLTKTLYSVAETPAAMAADARARFLMNCIVTVVLGRFQ